MRTRRFPELLALILAAILPLFIAGPVFAESGAQQNWNWPLAQPENIVGLWSLVDEILDACPTGNPVRTVIDLKMFLRDGNMIEAPGTPGVGAPPLQRGVPGLGTWKYLGGRHYQAAFRFFRYDGSDDSFAGTQTAVVDIELGKDGQTLTGSTTTNIYDANGVLITTRCTTSTGSRVE
ncbi:MAG TPA: hypothetical protein VMS64_01620 [Candidatus Methylomirabilis sp.]|nr:hypothetical protein [Candidatus Methylomirabilis sp.]